MTLNQSENSKLIWMIAGGLTALILLLLTYLWIGSNTEENASATPTATVPTQKKEKVAPVTAASPQAVEQSTASEPVASTLIDEKILKDEIPKNASLAKEEVAKLDDIQKQLNEQEKNLASQHSDADQLIKLKEEQIKLLEQQLAAQNK